MYNSFIEYEKAVMNIEFIKQQVKDHITERDEILLYNCEEDMMNGPHTVASIGHDGEVTLVGTGRNEGTISVIFITD